MLRRIVKNIARIIGKYATKSGTREITRHKHVKHVTETAETKLIKTVSQINLQIISKFYLYRKRNGYKSGQLQKIMFTAFCVRNIEQR